MKSVRCCVSAIAGAAIASLTIVAAIAFADAPTEPKWYASLYADDPTWVQIQVDTRDLATNEVARDVVVSVKYLDADGGPIGGSTFDFTSGNLQALVGGNVYQQFYPSPYAAAVSVQGLTLHSSLSTMGTLFDLHVTHGKNGTIQFPVPHGHAPAAALVHAATLTTIAHMPAAKTTLTFLFPGGGTPNRNGAIGPFCCTGETAVVRTPDGRPAGYIYFYGFDEAENIGDGKSAASRVRLLLSAELQGGASGQAPPQGAVVFDAAYWAPGQTHGVNLGALSFLVSLDGAQTVTVNGIRKFEMGTLRATARVVVPR